MLPHGYPLRFPDQHHHQTDTTFESSDNALSDAGLLSEMDITKLSTFVSGHRDFDN